LLVADYAHSGQGRNQTTPVTTETDETLTERRGFTTRAETPSDGAQSSTKRTQTLAVLLTEEDRTEINNKKYLKNKLK
jgi:hypothetical protein